MDLFLPVKPCILVVDDTPINLSMAAAQLMPHYNVNTASSGAIALSLAADKQPDLILLDIMMPELDGYEVCRALKANPLTRHIPVIFLTGKADPESEELGMMVGAVDYITRPVIPAILLSRVQAHLLAASTNRSLHVSNEYLEFEVTKRTRQMAALQSATILALASLAEMRDFETGNHLKRTQHYMELLCSRLRREPRFSDYLSPERIQILVRCAPLHDIGKVGIPDRILLNPGRYAPEDFEIMKTHCALGRDAVANAQATTDEVNSFFEIAKELIYSHHEKWNGSGYPCGLAGDLIPIPARLMALADVYDALISPRVYKDGLSHEQASRTIVEGRGEHFDPDVVDAFIELEAEFQAVAARFADSSMDVRRKAAQVTGSVA